MKINVLPHIKLTLATAVLSCMFAWSPAFGDPPTTGNLLGDARLIVTSEKGDIRLWSHPPRVLVLSNDPWVKSELLAVRDRLIAAVKPVHQKALFGRWRFNQIPQGLGLGDETLRMRLVRGGPSGFNLRTKLGPGEGTVSDIVVAVGNRRQIAVLNGLWGMTRKATRAQMEGGPARCYYEARSSDGIFHGAYVSIVIADPAETKDCIWEELLHTLGILTDAKGSAFFTFDNQAGQSSEKQANDILLIKALYESGVWPSGSPEQVIDHLAKLIDDEDD